MTREYPVRAYALLQNPQALGVETSAWAWVDGEPLTDGQLEVVVGDQVAERHTLTPYRVRQASGEARGYEVQSYDPNAPARSRRPTSRPTRSRSTRSGQPIACGWSRRRARWWRAVRGWCARPPGSSCGGC